MSFRFANLIIFGQNVIMNMFKPTKAKSIKEYFDMLTPERRTILEFLDNFIKTNATSLKPSFASNMLGYGSFEYKNSRQEIGEWPVISLASQKNYISLYVCALDKNQYIAEKYKNELGKVSVGKSCIRFKKLEDLNLDTLKKILKIAEKSPGLVAT